MAEEEGKNHIAEGDQRNFYKMLGTPWTSEQRIKLREEVVGIAFAQPANEKESYGCQKRKYPVSGYSQGGELSEFRACPLRSE